VRLRLRPASSDKSGSASLDDKLDNAALTRGPLTLPGRRRSPLFRPAGFPQRLSEQEFDLAVQAAQVIVCPALNGVEHILVDPKQEWFTIRHDAY